MATKFKSKFNNSFEGKTYAKGDIIDEIPKGMDAADFEAVNAPDDEDTDAPETVKHVVTQEEIDANPEAYAEKGVKAGDEIDIPNPEYKAPEKKTKRGRK